jgi:hypothetical protein
MFLQSESLCSLLLPGQYLPTPVLWITKSQIFLTTQSPRAFIACQDSKLKRKGEFQNTHKAKGHQLCNGQQSAHTLCLCHSRKVSHYTVRIPMTSGPVLHVRTQNLKERQNWNTHKPKGHQKCNGQQSALNPWLPDLELQQPLASYWGIEYRSSSSTNQSKQEYFWTNSEWSTEYRRAFNIDM